MSLLKYTNYLGTLATGLLGVGPPTLENVGQYEAVITFCAYISRLNYDLMPRKILEAYKYLNYSPIIFNTVVGFLTRMNLTPLVPLEGLIKDTTPIAGCFIYDQPDDLPLSVTLFDYSVKGASLIFPGEKVIVVGFRGTLSFKTLGKDFNMLTKPLSNIFSDLPSVSTGVGKAHGGFINGLANVLKDIIDTLDRLLAANPDVARIIITGHSLGGGYAHLCGMGLANMKRNGKKFPPLHIISFGAPKAFSESGRDMFNILLTEGHVTLDRIVNSPVTPDPLLLSMNVIPGLPVQLYQPGFTLLTTEKYLGAKTPRSRYVANTRKAAGHNSKQAWFSPSRITGRNYNPLPSYPEFFSKFKDGILEPSFTSDNYKELIGTSINGTVYTTLGKSASLARSIVQRLLKLDASQLAAIGQAAKEAEKVTAEEIKVQATEELKDPLIVENMKEAKNVEENVPAPAPAPAPQAGAKPQPQLGGAWFTSGTNATKAIQTYKTKTLEYFPNEVVYTCSAITSPIFPPVQCHLGYMGVGWLGVGSAIIPWRARVFLRKAVIYYINGSWNYVSDKTPLFTQLFPATNVTAIKANANGLSATSARKRKTRKTRKTRKL